jgi:hypothetical protein
MTANSDIANVRPITEAFVQCFDATTYGRTVFMTEAEEGRLCSALQPQMVGDRSSIAFNHSARGINVRVAANLFAIFDNGPSTQ